MAVYLLHFSRPYHHARHYLGWSPAKNLDARIADHQAGRGARLCQVVIAAGITLELARVWPDADRAFERRIKASRQASQYCPVCRLTINARRRARAEARKATGAMP